MEELNVTAKNSQKSKFDIFMTNLTTHPNSAKWLKGAFFGTVAVEAIGIGLLYGIGTDPSISVLSTTAQEWLVSEAGIRVVFVSSIALAAIVTIVTACILGHSNTSEIDKK